LLAELKHLHLRILIPLQGIWIGRGGLFLTEKFTLEFVRGILMCQSDVGISQASFAAKLRKVADGHAFAVHQKVIVRVRLQVCIRVAPPASDAESLKDVALTELENEQEHCANC